jgi:hypothetical protein
MICNRCAKELPSDTPVCRSCGPVTLSPGSGALPPLPVVSFLLPGLTTVPPAPSTLPAPSIASVAPATPPRAASAPKPERQSKAQRRRAALAGRAGEAPTARTDLSEPSLVGFPRPRPITMLARLDLFVGAVEAIAAVVVLSGRVALENAATGPIGLGTFLAADGALSLVAATGLFLVSPMGWYSHLALVATRLLWGSWANVLAVPAAAYLLRPGVKLLLSGRDLASLEPPERARIRKDVESPALVPVTVAVLYIVAALRLVPVVWMIVSGF